MVVASVVAASVVVASVVASSVVASSVVAASVVAASVVAAEFLLLLPQPAATSIRAASRARHRAVSLVLRICRAP